MIISITHFTNFKENSPPRSRNQLNQLNGHEQVKEHFPSSRTPLEQDLQLVLLIRTRIFSSACNRRFTLHSSSLLLKPSGFHVPFSSLSLSYHLNHTFYKFCILSCTLFIHVLLLQFKTRNDLLVASQEISLHFQIQDISNDHPFIQRFINST